MGQGKIFGSIEEVVIAYENRVVGLHAKINLKHKGSWFKDTTVGRAIFNSILPSEMDYIDALIDKIIFRRHVGFTNSKFDYVIARSY